MVPVQRVLFSVESGDPDKSRSGYRERPHFRGPEVVELEIPDEDVVRRIVAAVEALDLSKVLRTYQRKGGFPYHPRVLLSVILLGMTESVRSGRELARHCRYDARYRFVTGGQEPSARSFDRFVLRLAPFMDDLMSQIMDAGKQTFGTLGSEVAIDGTKLACSASWWKHRKDSSEPPSDPDARLMKSHGRGIVGYNAQIAIDTTRKMIVGADLSAEQADWHLAGFIMRVMKRQFGQLPSVAIADSGYECPGSIATLARMGVDSLFAPRENLNEHWQLNEDYELSCPSGKLLVVASQTMITGRVNHVFRPDGGCRGCHLAATCPVKGSRLSVPEGQDPGARHLNRLRFDSHTYAGAMSRRKRVEFPFAQLKHHDRFGKLLRRGIAKARLEFLLWVISYNIRQLPLSIWRQVRLVMPAWVPWSAWLRILSHKPEQQVLILHLTRNA